MSGRRRQSALRPGVEQMPFDQLQTLLAAARRARSDLKMLEVARDGRDLYKITDRPAWGVDKTPARRVLKKGLRLEAVVTLLSHPQHL